MAAKVKKHGFGLELRSFCGSDERPYLVFRTASGSFHTFVEVEAKQAARLCGAREPGTTRQMWEAVWRHS